jgi:hypothetical protein
VSGFSYTWAGINCLGDATIMVMGTNNVKGFYAGYPGIHVATGKTLTIKGSGTLNASSNSLGAGIGGGYNLDCGNIKIDGSTVNAQGGSGAAGIGSGYGADGYSNCGDIIISGGTVNATGGMYGAGIGSGYCSSGVNSCGDITISGGDITAKGGTAAAGIGTGCGINPSYPSTCGTITIGSGVTSVTATKGAGSPNSIGAGVYGSCTSVNIDPAAASKVTQN